VVDVKMEKQGSNRVFITVIELSGKIKRRIEKWNG